MVLIGLIEYTHILCQNYFWVCKSVSVCSHFTITYFLKEKSKQQQQNNFLALFFALVSCNQLQYLFILYCTFVLVSYTMSSCWWGHIMYSAQRQRYVPGVTRCCWGGDMVCFSGKGRRLKAWVTDCSVPSSAPKSEFIFSRLSSSCARFTQDHFLCAADTQNKDSSYEWCWIR